MNEIKTQAQLKFLKVHAPFGLVVYFWAPWCTPCKKIGPELEELAVKYPNISFVKVNADESDALIEDYHIRSVPTILMFEYGAVNAISLGDINQVTKWVENLEPIKSIQDSAKDG